LQPVQGVSLEDEREQRRQIDRTSLIDADEEPPLGEPRISLTTATGDVKVLAREPPKPVYEEPSIKMYMVMVRIDTIVIRGTSSSLHDECFFV